jgi:hypothetical protein
MWHAFPTVFPPKEYLQISQHIAQKMAVKRRLLDLAFLENVLHEKAAVTTHNTYTTSHRIFFKTQSTSLDLVMFRNSP